MVNSFSDEEFEERASVLLNELLNGLGPELSHQERGDISTTVRCGELDTALAGLLDLSGASHLFVIPSDLIPKIKEFLDFIGKPGPDDDDYLWCAAKGAIEYNLAQVSAKPENHTIAFDLPEPDYDLVEKKAASSGTSPQELITSWVKERIGELAYA